MLYGLSKRFGMKRLLSILISALTVNYAYGNAGDVSANLRIKVSNPTPVKTYFLCVSNMGCINLLSAQKIKKIPLGPGTVDYIFLANTANLQMFPQALPNSCNVSLDSQQTLTIYGKVAITSQHWGYIQDLKCVVR